MPDIANPADLAIEVANAVKPPLPPARKARATRPVIKDGQWQITIQLEVGNDVLGDPLVLHFSDTQMAGPKRERGGPEDVGYLISRAIDQRALQLRPTKGKK